ncbi:MAG: hypothetical protein CME59_05575 [Halioglobus sp.]|nr:hypothetical protein [Halioglobus sp.]
MCRSGAVACPARQEPTPGATGKALHYLHSEWSKLNAYLEDGRLEIDNNLAENVIRPFATGRKTGCSETRWRV